MKKLFAIIALLGFCFASAQDVPNEDIVTVDESTYAVAGLEVKPEFPGGMKAFYQYISQNYKMPMQNGLTGKVIVTFVIDKDGSVTDIKVLRDVGYGTGKEAVRILKNSPKWNPGKQNGQNVRAMYTLPIQIKT